MKLNKGDVRYGILFLLCFLVFFNEALFQNVTFFYRDILRYYHPMHFFATEAVQGGFIPYWNPYVFCGYPFLATVQHALFYPLSLLHYLFPFDYGFKFFFLIHYAIGGLGIYLLLRAIGLSAMSCLIGGIIFTFNGYLLSLMNLLTSLSAVVWVSFAILFFLRAQKHSWLWLILSAFTLAGQFYSGQPEVMFLTALFLVAFAVYPFSGNVRIGRNLYLFFLVLVFSAIIILPQFLLFKEMLGLGSAQRTSYAQVSFWSFHPLELPAMIVQRFSWDFLQSATWFRQTWLRSFYFGIIPLFFVTISFSYRKLRRITIFFSLMALAGLILAFGKYTPFFEVLVRLPGFQLIRYPIKYIMFLNFSIVCMAAIGFESWMKGEQQKDIQKLLAGYSSIFLLVCLIMYQFRHYFLEWIGRNYLPSPFSENLARLHTLYWPLVCKEGFVSMFFLCLLVLLWFNRHRFSKTVFTLLTISLLAINVLSANFNGEPLIKATFYKHKSPVVKFLSQKLGENRFHFDVRHSKELTLSELAESKLPFFPNLNMPFHLADCGIYESIDLEKKENVLRILGTQPSYTTTTLANMLGLKYIFTEKKLDEPGVRQIDTLKMFRVYENTQVLPRVKIYNRVISDHYEDLAKVNFILSKNFYPERELFVTANREQSMSRVEDDETQRATIISSQPNNVMIHVHSKNPAWLALFDYYYPGWSVTVNGNLAHLYEANYLFRAVEVPAGNSLVKFTYVPVQYYWGLSILVAFLTVLSVGFVYRIKRLP